MNSIDVLLKEYETLRQEILTAINSRMSILSFGLGTIGLLLTGGMATNAFSNGLVVSGLILIILVPAITTFVLFMWLGEYQRMQRAGRFLAGLELRINEMAKERLLTWESDLLLKRQHMKYPYNTTVMLLTSISLISLLIGVIVSNLSIDRAAALTIVGIIFHFVIYSLVILKVKKLYQ